MGKLAKIKNFMTNVAAAGLVSASLASPASSEDSPRMDHAESHDILLMDVSSSMDDADLKASFDGVARHYLSEDAMMNYRAGICTAATVIYFGNNAVPNKTHLLCNEHDVHAFLAENIDEKNIASARARAGGGTYVPLALSKASLVLAAEKDVLNIEPSLRRVLLIGDEEGGAADAARINSLRLSSNFGATVSAISIGSSTVRDYFASTVVTQPRSKHVLDYNGHRREIPISAGVAEVAMDADQVGKKVQAILSLGAY